MVKNIDQQFQIPLLTSEDSGVDLAFKNTPRYLVGQIDSSPGEDIQFNLPISDTLLWGGMGGLFLFCLLPVWFYAKFNVITNGNEAFIRTGGLLKKKKCVVVGNNCLAVPRIHKLVRVPLHAFSIEVKCLNKSAVRTKDHLRADLRVSFQVWVEPSDDNVSKAATKLSQNGQITIEKIDALLNDFLQGVISAAARTKDLSEIDSDQLGFSTEIAALVRPHLQELGLTLDQVTISEISANYNYNLDDVLDAEGARRHNDELKENTEAAQKRRQERMELLEIERELEKIEIAHREGYNAELNRMILREEVIEREKSLLEKERQLRELKQTLAGDMESDGDDPRICDLEAA